MSEFKALLVTLSNGNYLIKVAIQINTKPENMMTADMYDRGFFLEDICREWIYSKLPEHVQSFGNIVEVEDIFDISVY